MKLVYGMCGLGLAQAVAMASAMGTNQVSAVEHRELQDVQMGLCGSSTSGDGSSVANFCAFPSQQIASQTTWSPCCLSDTNPTKDIVCRTFTVDGAYCSDSASDCDAALTTQQASWDFQISWNAIPGGEQCCKTCTCFGDPECVAFNGTKNLWIPCDARVVNGAGWCPMWEYRCNEISSENTGGCTWIGGSMTTTQGANSGWDIATQGSPCVPTLPVDQLTMDMYRAGSFDATLGMGERGVIKLLDLTMGSIQAKMDADGCFATGTLADWTGTNIPATLPAGWYVETPAGDPSTWEVVKWHVFDSTNNIAVDFACVRAIKNGVIGGARINVNAITAPTSLTGSGFCESTTIPEAGDNSGSAALHAQCVQDRPTSPLQACKHLVAMGASETEVEECANQFCATAQLSGAERTSCTSELGGNSGDYKQWRKWYCIAIANQGTFSSSQCQATVNRDGWNTATETMGRGIEDQDVPIGSVSCSANLADYAVQPGASENECRQGAFMQFNQSGVWVDAYFFPATCGPLSFSIAYSSANAKFFTESYRLIQCDPQTKEVCRALGKCEDVAGAIFSIDYSTVASSVMDALNNGGLVCIPLNDGSGKYSCSNTTPNAPTKELCPCENCNQNRRLLEVAGVN